MSTPSSHARAVGRAERPLAAVSFGSDVHEGGRVGHGFSDAAAMAEAVGFRRPPDPLDFWRR